MKKRLMMVLACMLLSLGTVLAQNQIKGTVISSEDGQPVIGATVKVVGTNNGTVTDANGQFSISVRNGAALEVSYVGMTTKKVNASSNMRIALDNDDQLLDEVMVVAFGTAKKSAFTGSAKVVGSDKISQAQVSDVTSALAGAVAGVTLTSDNGGPGSSPTIRIRGFSSLNAGKDPLIIVDGAPYGGSDLNNLNPSDIESMTILKDAASAALYGARGANGVVIITTKKAQKDQQTVVTFDAKWGGNSRALQHYDVITSPAQYYEMQYEALKNYYIDGGYSAKEAWHAANSVLTGAPDSGGLGYDIWSNIPNGQYLIGFDGRLNPNATLGKIVDGYLITPDNWEDVGTRTGLRQEYNVSINGSSDRSTFYMSLGYLDNQGISYNSDFKRLSARLRADYQVKKWLKVGSNISYARFDGNALNNNGNDTSTGNIWAFTSQMAPIYPVYVRNADGSIKVDDNGIKMMDYGNGMNAGGVRGFIADANPLQDVLLNTTNYEGNAMTGNFFADINILPELTFTLNGTFNLDETRGTYVYNGYYGQFDTTGGTVEKYHQRLYNYNLQQLLNYNTTIAGHNNLGVMIGHEYYDSRTAYLSASKSGMFSDENKELGGAVVDGKNAYSYKDRYNNEGYFGRIQYDYDGQYFASASYRRDASSRFHPDNRWGSFWSLGAAWIISKEKFFNVDWVDMLKVKASIGSQGNDNIGNYRYVDQFVINNSNDEVGTSFSTKGNKDITWETQTNFNVGVEFELFKHLIGSIEYYRRTTTDMLMAYSVAPSIGYSSYYANVGDLYNTGVELDLQWSIIRKKDIDWNFNFNISSIKNRITSLDEGKKNESYYTADGREIKGFRSGSFFVAEGQSIYTWRMKEYAGVDPETGESLWWRNTFDDDGNWTGRTKTKNYNAPTNEQIAAGVSPDDYADYYITEQTTVPKWQGGFGTSVKFYGFDFSVNCSFQLGGKGYDYTYSQFMAPPTNANSGYNFHKDLLKAWTVDNPNSNIPRFQYDDLYTTYQSTRFLTSSNYLNIESINLGYTFPSSLTRKFEVNSLRVYVACQNVGYFSARKGFDPRQTYSDSSTASAYSPMRTISAGLTVQF